MTPDDPTPDAPVPPRPAAEPLKNYDPDRFYRIRFENGRYVTGYNRLRHEYLLAGDVAPHLVVGLVFSSMDGTYLRREYFPKPELLDLPREGWEAARHAYEMARVRWMLDLGFVPDHIGVRHFLFPDLNVGIADWPNHMWNRIRHYPSVEAAVADLDDEFITGFYESKSWVLYWAGSDFWMTEDGNISAT